MENGKQKKVYELIDVDGLANLLSEDDWKVQTKNVHTDDLYEMNVVWPVSTENPIPVEVVRQVRSKWATLFFSLKSSYQELIMSYAKIDTDADKTRKTEGRPEGTDQQQVE